MRGNLATGVVDQTGTLLAEYGRQPDPLPGENRPRTHRDDQGIGIEGFTIDLYAAHDRFTAANHARHPPCAYLGTLTLCCVHHRGRELARMNDRRGVCRAESIEDYYTVGQPVEFDGDVPARISVGDHEATV